MLTALTTFWQRHSRGYADCDVRSLKAKIDAARLRETIYLTTEENEALKQSEVSLPSTRAFRFRTLKG